MSVGGGLNVGYRVPRPIRDLDMDLVVSFRANRLQILLGQACYRGHRNKGR